MSENVALLWSYTDSSTWEFKSLVTSILCIWIFWIDSSCSIKSSYKLLSKDWSSIKILFFNLKKSQSHLLLRTWKSWLNKFSRYNLHFSILQTLIQFSIFNIWNIPSIVFIFCTTFSTTFCGKLAIKIFEL